MRTAFLALVASFTLAAASMAADSPVLLKSLTTEHMVNPVGIGDTHPRLSWKLSSNRPGEIQRGYEIRAASTREKLTAGATTMWERWDGYTPERGFQASSMNSFNHYSFGSVGKWLFSGAGGIQIDEKTPGFKKFMLKPQFSSQLPAVKTTLNSPYGVIASSWKVENGQVSYDATVPPNSSATLTLPVGRDDLKASGDPTGQRSADGANTTIALPPGTYKFSFPAGAVK